MKSKIHLDPKIVIQICELYKQKHSAKEIGLKFNVSEFIVKKYLKLNGINIKSRLIIDEDIKRKIIQMYNDNIKITDIGKEFNISGAKIVTRLREWGIKFNGKKRRNFMRLLNISEIDVINKYLEFKKDIKKTASHYRVGRLIIKKILNKHNITNWRQDLRKLLDLNKNTILDACKNGVSLAFIASEIGVTDGTLYNYCKKILNIEIKYPLVTAIEVKIKTILDSLNIEYKSQFEISNNRFDFYLPHFNLFIEANGDYWHGNTKYYQQNELNNYQLQGQLRDFKKNQLAKKLKKKILFFWEFEINERMNIIKYLLKNLDTHIPEQNNQFDFLTDKYLTLTDN